MAYYDYIAHGYNELFGEEQRKKAVLIGSLIDVKEKEKLQLARAYKSLGSDYSETNKFNEGID